MDYLRLCGRVETSRRGFSVSVSRVYLQQSTSGGRGGGVFSTHVMLSRHSDNVPFSLKSYVKLLVYKTKKTTVSGFFCVYLFSVRKSVCLN